MPLYYFDLREDDRFTIDEVGTDLPSDEVARGEAAVTLAQIAKDVLPGGRVRKLSIEIRDGTKNALAVARLSLEMVPLR